MFDILHTSDEINKITEALAKAQGEIEQLELDAVNPHFKSKYASLAETRKKCRLPLANNGLAIIQCPSAIDGGRLSVITLLSHISGQWIRAGLCLRMDKDTPQGMASATTYGKRIGMQAMLGLVGDDDDDGNAAEEQQRQSLSRPPPVLKEEEAMTFDKFDGNHTSFLNKHLKATTSNMDVATYSEVANHLHGKRFTKTNITKAIEEAK